MNDELKVTLDIENFQALPKAHLEFKPGLTVIMGETGSGKTGIFRALRALALNPRAASKWIGEHGESTRVKLKVPGSAQVTWERRKEEVSYQFEGGARYTKLNRGNLFSIEPKFPLVLDPQRDRLANLHTEWDQLFPFDLSPRDLFRLFEDIFQVLNSEELVTDLKKDVTKKDAKREAILEEKLNLTLQIRQVVEVVQAEIWSKVEEPEKAMGLLEQEQELRKGYLAVTGPGREYDELVKNRPAPPRKGLEIGDYRRLEADFERTQKLAHGILDTHGIVTLKKAQPKVVEQLGIYWDYGKTKEKELVCMTLEAILKMRREFVVTDIQILTDITKVVELVTSLEQIKVKVQDHRENLKKLDDKILEFKVCPACGKLLNG